jgi:hypothetical protein
MNKHKVILGWKVKVLRLNCKNNPFKSDRQEVYLFHFWTRALTFATLLLHVRVASPSHHATKHHNSLTDYTLVSKLDRIMVQPGDTGPLRDKRQVTVRSRIKREKRAFTWLVTPKLGVSSYVKNTFALQSSSYVILSLKVTDDKLILPRNVKEAHAPYHILSSSPL